MKLNVNFSRTMTVNTPIKAAQDWSSLWELNVAAQALLDSFNYGNDFTTKMCESVNEEWLSGSKPVASVIRPSDPTISESPSSYFGFVNKSSSIKSKVTSARCELFVSQLTIPDETNMLVTAEYASSDNNTGSPDSTGFLALSAEVAGYGTPQSTVRTFSPVVRAGVSNTGVVSIVPSKANESINSNFSHLGCDSLVTVPAAYSYSLNSGVKSVPVNIIPFLGPFEGMRGSYKITVSWILTFEIDDAQLSQLDDNSFIGLIVPMEFSSTGVLNANRGKNILSFNSRAVPSYSLLTSSIAPFKYGAPISTPKLVWTAGRYAAISLTDVTSLQNVQTVNYAAGNTLFTFPNEAASWTPDAVSIVTTVSASINFVPNLIP